MKQPAQCVSSQGALSVQHSNKQTNKAAVALVLDPSSALPMQAQPPQSPFRTCRRDAVVVGSSTDSQTSLCQSVGEIKIYSNDRRKAHYCSTAVPVHISITQCVDGGLKLAAPIE
eukprot:4501-Heterococcus_DN1.PRE.2